MRFIRQYVLPGKSPFCDRLRVCGSPLLRRAISRKCTLSQKVGLLFNISNFQRGERENEARDNTKICFKCAMMNSIFFWVGRYRYDWTSRRDDKRHPPSAHQEQQEEREGESKYIRTAHTHKPHSVFLP